MSQDVPFEWTLDCHNAFEKLKNALVTTPIIQSPDWSLPFELMCNNISEDIHWLIEVKVQLAGQTFQT